MMVFCRGYKNKGIINKKYINYNYLTLALSFTKHRKCKSRYMTGQNPHWVSNHKTHSLKICGSFFNYLIPLNLGSLTSQILWLTSSTALAPSSFQGSDSDATLPTTAKPDWVDCF